MKEFPILPNCSVRLNVALARAGVDMPEKVYTHYDDIVTTPGFGRKCLEELNNFLRESGYTVPTLYSVKWADNGNAGAAQGVPMKRVFTILKANHVSKNAKILVRLYA